MMLRIKLSVLSILIPVFLFSVLHASPDLEEDGARKNSVSRFEKLNEGLYVGRSLTPAKEEIYFGYEKVTRQNIENIKGFLEATKRMLGQENGFLVAIVKILGLNKEIPYEATKETSGFSPEEHAQFIQMLKDRGFNDREKSQGLRNISTGSNYLILSPNQSYFAYISKEPITGPRSFGVLSAHSTLKDYLAVNKDLIMIVSSTPDIEGNSSYTIGIFRHLQSHLDRTYSRVSMQLHGWVAHITHRGLSKKYIRLNPTPFMSKLLEEKLDKNIDYFKGEDKNDEGVQGAFPDFNFKETNEINVKGEALEKFYLK